MNREEREKKWEELKRRYEEEFKKVEDLRRELGQPEWVRPYERIERPKGVGNTSRRNEIREGIKGGEQRLGELRREMDEAEKQL